MSRIGKRNLLTAPRIEKSSPLDAAVTNRDGSTLDMVAQSIERGDTMLAFQPIVTVRPPRAPAFYEAFIRVLDSTGRVIPARDFMAIVEPTELGREIDCVSLDASLRTLSQVPDIRISVNMSARSIGYRKWIRILDRWTKRDPNLGERLILEVSEASALTVPELLSGFMAELRGKGVAVALDNFGAGFTSLRHFRDFHFDLIKIDGHFTQGIRDRPDNQVLVSALVRIARQFDIFSVAERVESEADAACLCALGVDCLQGHLFGAATIRPPWIAKLQARASA